MAVKPTNYFFSSPLHIQILSFGVLLLPFIYSDSLFHKTNIPKYAYIALLSISVFISWLYYSWKIKNLTFYFNSLFILLFAIFIFAGSSILWSDFKGIYELEIINFAALMLIAFTCMQIKNSRHIQLILVSAVIGGTLSVLFAFIQAWGWNPLNYLNPGFPASSFINKNHFTNYIDLILPIAFALFITLKDNNLKWVSAIAVSLLFSYIILSYTRASLLSLLIILFLILYFSNKYPSLRDNYKKISTYKITFIILLSLLLINSPLTSTVNSKHYEKIYSSVINPKIKTSSRVRIDAYNNASKMIKENLVVGTGLGSFAVAFSPYRYNAEDDIYVGTRFLNLHNDPLQVIIELGVFGGVLCFSFVLLLFYKSYIKLRPSYQADKSQTIIKLFLLLAVLASILHSFLSFPLHMPASSFIAFIFIGLLLQSDSKKINGNKATLAVCIIFAASTLFFSGKVYGAFISSSFYLNTAVKSLYTYHPKKLYKLQRPLSNSACLKAEKYTQKAIDRFSNDFVSQWQALIIYKLCVKDSESFLKLSHTILSHNPYNVSALQTAALISFNKQNFSLAQRYYSILNYLRPHNSGYPLLLGHIAVKQKDYASAHRLYLKTLRLAPNNTAAQNMINKLTEKGYLQDVPNNLK